MKIQSTLIIAACLILASCSSDQPRPRPAPVLLPAFILDQARERCGDMGGLYSLTLEGRNVTATCNSGQEVLPGWVAPVGVAQ